MTRRKRATIDVAQDCPQPFVDLLKQTMNESDFMEVEEDNLTFGLAVYETGPFRDVAEENLPFGPLAADVDLGDDTGAYAECHVVSPSDEDTYIGVWYHDQNTEWTSQKPEFQMKVDVEGDRSRFFELGEEHAKDVVLENGGWDYVE